MFKVGMLRLVDEWDLPSGQWKWVRHWDLAATEESKDNPDPDWTVGALVGLYDGRLYVRDIQRFQCDPAETEERIRDQMAWDNEVVGVRVPVRMEQEPGASGKITISHYARHVLLGADFDGIPSSGDKPTRARPWSAMVRRGEVILVSADWNSLYKAELGLFPQKGTHDDQVDATSGAFEYLTGIHKKRKTRLEIIV
jgi:predicted phage terminase large subunit-like protein